MIKPELLVVAGCNAAGKSSFIRSRMSQLRGYEVIMTDVYKARTRDIFLNALSERRDIVFETVFNDANFKDWIDLARQKGYATSLVALFLDSPQHSIERVGHRSVEEGGLKISGSNVKLNFNESFKNIAEYFFYFDVSDFIYTGITANNILIMQFAGSTLKLYRQSGLEYPQKFASYSHGRHRLNEEAYNIITTNRDFDRDNPQIVNSLGF